MREQAESGRPSWALLDKPAEAPNTRSSFVGFQPQDMTTCENNRKTMDSPFRYEVIIYWSEDDEAFIAEVPELPGCAADGATYQEALANVELVTQEWIPTARELGRDIPEPKGRLMYA